MIQYDDCVYASSQAEMTTSDSGVQFWAFFGTLLVPSQGLVSSKPFIRNFPRALSTGHTYMNCIANPLAYY